MARPGETTAPAVGVLAERLSSPGLLLALLGQEAMRRLRDANNAHDLKPRQFQLLGVLQQHGAMGQRELRQAMGVDPSILVTLLNPLEREGLLSRERDADDRRRYVIHLTPKGERRLEDAARAQREAEDELFAGLDEDQRATLAALLGALRDSFPHGATSAAAALPRGAEAQLAPAWLTLAIPLERARQAAQAPEACPRRVSGRRAWWTIRSSALATWSATAP